MTDFGQLIRNVSKSAVLTASGWDTDPSNLDNAIDGDLDNPTGTGETTLETTGYSGYINIEMPAAGRYLVACKIDTWSTAGFCALFIQSKHDGYCINNDQIKDIAQTSEGTPGDTLVAFVSSASFRLAFFDAIGQKLEMKLYDISIWELV